MIICVRTKVGTDNIVNSYLLINLKTHKREWVSNLKMKMLLFAGAKNFVNVTMESSEVTVHHTDEKGALALAYYFAEDKGYVLNPDDIETVLKYGDNYLRVKFRGRGEASKYRAVKVYVRDENFTGSFTPADRAFKDAAVIEYMDRNTQKHLRATKEQFFNDIAPDCDNVVEVYKIPFPDPIRSNEKLVDLTDLTKVKRLGIWPFEIVTEKLSYITR